MRQGVLGLATAINGRPNSSRIKVWRWANECLAYLALNPSDVNPFASLLNNGRSDVQALSGWPALDIGASFKHTDLAAYLTTYAAIHDACPLAMWTYYKHLAGDHPTTPYANTLTDIPSMATTISTDWDAMVTGLGKPSIISELGYASHADLLGSENLQASFVVSTIGLAHTFSAQTVASRPAIGRIDFKFLTEMFEALLTAHGYTGNLRKFVKSLGLMTDLGVSKAAMTLFIQTMGGRALQGRAELAIAGTPGVDYISIS
jgi:hypothetical protein